MTYDFKYILYEKNADEMIATMTLNRPDKLNALNTGMRDEIDEVIKDLEKDDDTKVVIVKGAGKAFCVGYDLQEVQSHWWSEKQHAHMDPIWRRRVIRNSQDRWMRFWNLRQITIAQVHGYCLVGGVDFIGVCDLVFAAEDAKFGQPQARLQGLIHTFGLWPIYLGMRKTKEWLLTGDNMSGIEAERLGLINRAVPGDRLEQEVRAYAKKITGAPLYLLWAHKDATNRWYETQGIRVAMDTVDDLDAMTLGAKENREEFREAVLKGGLKEALKQRDAKFQSPPSGER